MRPETWQQIEESFAGLPGAKAEGVPANEINVAETRLGIRFPADYKEFLIRYGGAQLNESSFEDWIRRHALKVEPMRSGYIPRERWPEEFISRLRESARRKAV